MRFVAAVRYMALRSLLNSCGYKNRRVFDEAPAIKKLERKENQNI